MSQTIAMTEAHSTVKRFCENITFLENIFMLTF